MTKMSLSSRYFEFVNSVTLEMIGVAFCYGRVGVPAGSPARIYVPESHPGRRSDVINLAFVRNRSHGSSKQPQVLTDALPSTHPHCLTKQGIECHLFFATTLAHTFTTRGATGQSVRYYSDFSFPEPAPVWPAVAPPAHVNLPHDRRPLLACHVFYNEPGWDFSLGVAACTFKFDILVYFFSIGVSTGVPIRDNNLAPHRRQG